MPLIFENSDAVRLSPGSLYQWLIGSATTSAKLNPQQNIFETPIFNEAYPFSGREEALLHIFDNFKKVSENRFRDDRNSRPLPICTGLPGLGKTRLCNEAAVLFEDIIPGVCLYALISFGNDGNAYGKIDELLGIECSFAWRLVHSFFKSHHIRYAPWMRSKSPANRADLTLSMALSIIAYGWKEKHPNSIENINVYVAVDEYQILKQKTLNSLLDSICNRLGAFAGSGDSKLTFFAMLAGIIIIRNLIYIFSNFLFRYRP